MKQTRYTASGQLGLWASLPQPETFRSQLHGLLAANSNAVVEYDDLNPIETIDSGLTAITAVCDKIIARGNPAWVAPDYEKLLLTGPGKEFFSVQELVDGPDVGFRFVDSTLADGGVSDLPDAALDLLDLPYSAERPASEQVLSDELRQLGSAEGGDILFQPGCDAGTVGKGVHSKATVDLRPGGRRTATRTDGQPSGFCPADVSCAVDL